MGVGDSVADRLYNYALGGRRAALTGPERCRARTAYGDVGSQPLEQAHSTSPLKSESKRPPRVFFPFCRAEMLALCFFSFCCFRFACFFTAAAFAAAFFASFLSLSAFLAATALSDASFLAAAAFLALACFAPAWR